MPIRETDTHYYFPADENHRLSLIEEGRSDGFTWVSTSIHEGRMRMKFCRFEHYVEAQPEKVVHRLPRNDKGQERKRQNKSSKVSGKVRYAGRTGHDRPEWDA